ERVLVHGDVAPAEELLSGAEDLVFEDLLAATTIGLVARQKDVGDAVLPGRRQVDPDAVALALQERVGDLEQDAGAIARQGVAAAGAAVHQIEQNVYPLLDDIVGRLSLDVGDEADAAGVAFEPRIIETVDRKSTRLNS